MVDQDAQGEGQRDAEGLARGELLLLADEADDQRDAGQVAGAEQDAQYPPDESAQQPEQRMAVEQLRHPGKKGFQHYFTPFCLQDLDQLILGEEAFMAEILLALLVQEHLGGDDADLIACGEGLPFRGPDVVEDHLDLAGVILFDVLHDRLHHLAGDAAHRAQFDESDQDNFPRLLRCRFFSSALGLAALQLTESTPTNRIKMNPRINVFLIFCSLIILPTFF